ncbi:MAG TPA: aldo/keto reductase, partial [Terriglobales bacterium]|nr:aldo/keto reductase [Terriglobales bacterium]
MQYRQLGRTAWKVSDISFGAWAIGGAWGSVSDDESLTALHQAVDCGVNFIDTADVYGDGRSERLIAQLKKSRKNEIVVATKAGRRLPRQTVEGYSRQNLTIWVEDSLRNLSTDSLDLLQLHCPPSALYDRPET